MLSRIKKGITGSIKRRLYLLTCIVALIILLMVIVFAWTGNTLRTITSISRFERTHTVSRVEALVHLHKYVESRDPEDLNRFRNKMKITQSYNYVFGNLIKMSNELPDREFTEIILKTFVEADVNTAEILVNRIHILYWHPLMKELVGIAVHANEEGIKMEEQAESLVHAKNEKQRRDIFSKIEEIEKNFNQYEISFSTKTGEFASEIARIVNTISIMILLLSIGITGVLALFIIRSISVPMGRFISYSREVAAGNLDVIIPEISGDELLALKESMSTLLDLNRRLREEIYQKDRMSARIADANRQIVESEIKQKTIISNISEVISIMDSDGIIRYKSSSIEKWFGWKPEDIIGSDGFSNIHPDDADRTKTVFNDILKERLATRTIECRYRCKDGTYKPIELTVLNLTDDPVINGVLLNYHDITERRRSEDALQTAEELYKNLVETSQDLIWQCDAEGRYIYLNSAWGDLFGYKVEEMLGKKFTDFQTPEIAARDTQEHLRLMKGNSIKGFETTHIGKNGKEIHLVFSAKFLSDENGNITGTCGTAYDITERKKEQEMLKRSEARYRELLNNIGAGVVVHAPDTSIIFSNNKASTIMGISEDKLLGRKITDLDIKFYNEDGNALPVDDHPVKSIIAVNTAIRDMIIGFSIPDSKAVQWQQVSGFPVIDSNGNITEIIISFVDITDRKKASEDLLKSEARYVKAQKIGHVGNWEYNIQTTEFWGSEEAKTIFGFDPNQPNFTTEEVESCIPDRENVHQVLVDLITKGSDYNIEYEMHPKNSNDTRIVWSIAELVRDSSGNPLTVTGVVQDITERKIAEELIKTKNEELKVLNEELNQTIDEIQKTNLELIKINNEKIRAEEALLKSNSFLNSIIESPKDIDIFSVDINGNYTSFNENHKRTIRNLYQTDVCIGANIFELITNISDRDQAAESFNRASAGEHFTVIQEYGPAGNKSSFELSFNPIFDKNTGIPSGVTLFIIDITERVKLELMLFQSQKMEAIGTLAGGIAHDFNNILGGIVGYTQLAALDLPGESKASKYINQILKASYRARELVQQILTFSKQTEVEKKPILVELVVREVVKLLKASLPSTIEIELNVKNPHVMINANPTHIHQVLMNLCTNAKQSIGNKTGRLTITIEKTAMIDKEIYSGFVMQDGEYVLIRVSDTGSGIPAGIINRVFEPYFTTKEQGEGTGLGLAVVHRIISAHNGGISIESRPGEGSTFIVALPHAEGTQETTDHSDRPVRGGSERVLFVDDEEFLVEMGREILQHLGYDVVATSYPEHALDIVKRSPDGIDLLITDMTMPKMTGEMLALRIHELRPDLPIILCTGFSESITRERADRAGIDSILLKPIIMESFSETIRKLLDNRKTRRKDE